MDPYLPLRKIYDPTVKFKEANGTNNRMIMPGWAIPISLLEISLFMSRLKVRLFRKKFPD